MPLEDEVPEEVSDFDKLVNNSNDSQILPPPPVPPPKRIKKKTPRASSLPQFKVPKVIIIIILTYLAITSCTWIVSKFVLPMLILLLRIYYFIHLFVYFFLNTPGNT